MAVSSSVSFMIPLIFSFSLIVLLSVSSSNQYEHSSASSMTMLILVIKINKVTGRRFFPGAGHYDSYDPNVGRRTLSLPYDQFSVPILANKLFPASINAVPIFAPTEVPERNNCFPITHPTSLLGKSAHNLMISNAYNFVRCFKSPSTSSSCFSSLISYLTLQLRIISFVFPLIFILFGISSLKRSPRPINNPLTIKVSSLNSPLLKVSISKYPMPPINKS